MQYAHFTINQNTFRFRNIFTMCVVTLEFFSSTHIYFLPGTVLVVGWNSSRSVSLLSTSQFLAINSSQAHPRLSRNFWISVETNPSVDDPYYWYTWYKIRFPPIHVAMVLVSLSSHNSFPYTACQNDHILLFSRSSSCNTDYSLPQWENPSYSHRPVPSMMSHCDSGYP